MHARPEVPGAAGGDRLPPDYPRLRPHRTREPSPTLTSWHRWNGVVVEFHRAREFDSLVPFHEHTVSMHFRGPVNLVQRRGGRAIESRVGSGDVLFTPVGEPKRLVHEEEVEVLKVKLAPQLVERVAEDAGFGRMRSGVLKDDFGTRDVKLQHICREFRAELERENLGGCVYAESLAVQLAVHLLRRYSTFSPTLDVPAGPLPRHKLRQAVEYMNDHLQDELTLQGIAQALSLSAFHFAHLFKRTTGSSPHRYLVELRIERAKSLLHATELPVTEVAQRVGFANASHFTHAFHRATGVTPSEFRRDM